MKNIFIAVLIVSGTMFLPGNLLAQKTMSTKAQSKTKSAVATPKVDASKETATLSPTVTSYVFTGKAEDWFMPAAETTFPALPYSYSALEPVIDKMTVELHYDKHHRGYFNNFKKAIEQSKLEKMSMYEIFATISDQSMAVRNNAGGYYNHVLYWSNMSPNGGGEPTGILLKHIINSFGSYEAFVKEMTDAGKTRFGSGWAWLSVDLKTKELFVSSSANQDNPLMDIADRRGYPILALDVWEHAYYLNYQNKRADYIDNFWKKVNWKDVEARFDAFEKVSGYLK